MTRLPIQISGLGIALCATLALTPAKAAWEPTRPVEIVVPAGTGGGADQMARTVQGIITKHQLMKQPIVVVNKAGAPAVKAFSTSRAQREIRTSSSLHCRTCSRRH